jgi:hypothetical protein
VRDREEISKYLISVFIVGWLSFNRLDALSSMKRQQWARVPGNSKTA